MKIDNVEEGRKLFCSNTKEQNSQIRFEMVCEHCGKETTQAAGSLFLHNDLLCNACRRIQRNKILKARNKRRRRSKTIRMQRRSTSK